MKTYKTFKIILSSICVMISMISCSEKEAVVSDNEIAEKIIAMEKEALDRWGNGDPFGYLEIFAEDVTYFNPFEGQRIDGLPAMLKYYGDQAGQIFIDKYEMTGAKVQVYGNIAVLTYHLFNYKKQPDGSLKGTVKWNSTKVYLLKDGNWKIVHNHWSFLQPELKGY